MPERHQAPLPGGTPLSSDTTGTIAYHEAAPRHVLPSPSTGATLFPARTHGQRWCCPPPRFHFSTPSRNKSGSISQIMWRMSLKQIATPRWTRCHLAVIWTYLRRDRHPGCRNPQKQCGAETRTGATSQEYGILPSTFIIIVCPLFRGETT